MDRLKKTLKFIIGAQKAIAKAFVGSALVLYGEHFVGIILILQGIQGGGLQALRKQFKRVQESVEKTKSAVKSVASDYKSEKAFNSVVTALDPKRTLEAITQLQLTVMTIITSANSEVGLAVAQGMSIGSIIADRAVAISKQIERLITGRMKVTIGEETHNKAEELLESIVLVWGRTLGLIVAYTTHAFSTVIGGAALGSQLLLESFEETIDPLLKRVNLPTLSGNPTAITIVQGAIVAAAFFADKLPFMPKQGAKLSTFSQLLYGPLFAVEKTLEIFLLQIKK